MDVKLGDEGELLNGGGADSAGLKRKVMGTVNRVADEF